MKDTPKPPSPGSPGDEHSTPSPPRRSRGKRILLWSGGGLAALILLVLLAGPPVVSAVTASRVVSSIEEATGATVELGDLDFDWPAHVEIRDMKVVPRGFTEPLLSVDRIEVTAGLFDALGGAVEGDVVITGPRILVEKNGDGLLNIEAMGGSRPARPSAPTSGPGARSDPGAPSMRLDVRVVSGEVAVRDGGRETLLTVGGELRLEGSKRSLDVRIGDPGDGRVTLSGTLDPGGGARGKIGCDGLSLENLSAAAGLFSPVENLAGRLKGAWTCTDLRGARVEGEGEFVAEDLVMTAGGRRVRVPTLVLTHHAPSWKDHRLVASLGEAGALTVAATVDADSAVAADITFQSDLEHLGEILREAIGMRTGVNLKGRARVDGHVSAGGDGPVRIRLGATVTDLAAVGRRFERIDDEIAFKAEGSWDGGARAVDVETLELTSSFASARGRGGVSLGASMSAVDSSVTVRADLAQVGGKLATFMEAPPSLAGVVTLEGSLKGDRYRVDAKLEDVAYGEYGPASAALVQEGALEMRRGGAFTITTGTLVSDAAALEYGGRIEHFMDRERSGTLAVQAVLQPGPLSDLLPGFAFEGPAQRTEVTFVLGNGGTRGRAKGALAGLIWIRREGNLTLSTEFDERFTLGDSAVAGGVVLRGLEVIPASGWLQEKEVRIDYDLSWKGGTLDIRRAGIASSFLRGDCSGRILGWSTAPEFSAFRGDFHYVPTRLSPILASFARGATMTGDKERSLAFRLDGKACAAGLLPVLRGTHGGLDVALARFTVEGVGVSGKVHADLKGGRLVSAAPLEVNGGRAEVRGAVDFNPEETHPASRFSFKARGVEANRDMGLILEKINPIFHTVGQGGSVGGMIESDFDLAWTGPVDPDEKDWIGAGSKALTGKGTFHAKNLVIEGSPTVTALLTAMGLASGKLEGELRAEDISVHDGKVWTEGMVLRMGRYTLRFHGWVGFDRRMALKVEIPLSESLVRRYPQLGKYVGTVMTVPLEGDVERPILNTQTMLHDLLKRAAAEAVKEGAGNLLDRLFKGKRR